MYTYYNALIHYINVQYTTVYDNIMLYLDKMLE
jgi:hypothetical protein